ncbi:MAG: hypothetical protein Q9157_004274 [Trypethelium eluteriae]
MANITKSLLNAAPLKPEIRLQQAISQYEADLTNEQRVIFRAEKSLLAKSPPGQHDVLRLTAEIDNRYQKKTNRCFGPRITNFLHAIQHFAAVGDVMVGGSQNIIACSVAIAAHGKYLERISMFIMQIGRSAPRYQSMALLYSHSKSLQSSLTEYYIIVVHLCRRLLRLTQNSLLKNFVSTLDDSNLNTFRSQLEQWEKIIKEEVNLLMAKDVHGMRQMRSFTARNGESNLRRRKLSTKLRVLNSCSMYDHETTWKQIRKLGSTTLYRERVEYEKWKCQPNSSALMCAGKLGSGKSVLLADIVGDLSMPTQGKNTPVAFFFCRHDIKESLKAQTVIGSLARQLLRHISDLGEVAEYLDENLPSLDVENLFDLLSRFVSPASKAYFVLDGLDECKTNERTVLMKYLCELQKHFDFHLCISLRLEPGNLDTLDAQKQRFLNTNMILIPEDNPEIEQFIESELECRIKSGKLNLGDPSLSLEIYDALVGRSQGMFLWAALQLDTLCALRTDDAIRHALNNLPKDLPDTFARILRQSRDGADDIKYDQKRILELIIAAHRPLTTEELREALSVVPGDTVWRPERLLNDVMPVLACCGSLIIVDEEEQTVRLGHHSIQQFLFSGIEQMVGFDCSIEYANSTMVNTIATYLNYGVFGTQLTRHFIPQMQLASASSRIVAATLQSSSNRRALALKFLKSKRVPELDVRKTLASLKYANTRQSIDNFQFYAYAKSFFLEHILTISEKMSIKYKLVVKAVRERSIDGPKTSENRANLLQFATKQGQTSLLQALIDAGKLEVNGEDTDGWTPLIWAARNRHEALVKLLLDTGKVEIDARDKYNNRTPLLYAAQHGHEAVVKLLLDTGKVDIDVRDKHNSRTPLSWAVMYGHDAIVKLLLDTNEVDVNVKDDLGRTPLFLAASHGHKVIVKLLLDTNKVDVNAKDNIGRTTLLWAAMDGHNGTVKLLLNTNKVNVNAKDDNGRTPLSWAAAGGYEATVKLLLDTGEVDVDATDNDNRTPLGWAIWCRKEAMVKLLSSYTIA